MNTIIVWLLISVAGSVYNGANHGTLTVVGKFRLDDYIDGAAYFALYGEAASNANNL